VAEKPILIAIAKEHPHLSIALVSLEDTAATRKYFTSQPPDNITLLSAEGDGGKVLHMLGDTSEALPYSFFLKADGSLCDSHYGLLGTDRVDDWMKRC
jgi:hypothetical protein